MSRLLEQPITFDFKLGRVVKCERLEGDRDPVLKPEGGLSLYAGHYLLTVAPRR